ncbi:MAG: hypothetical protein J6A17_02260 [Bacilli bacterium]|nr:hypothetical protein [Bacilli bacterium]
MLNNLIIAHRGIHDNENIPENSILAFRKAIRNKLPIEFDIHITKDNKLVVFHDDNLKRMTNVDKNIQELDFNEIRRLTLLDTNEKIPTLKEVLDLVSGKVLIDIEIKNTKKKKLIVKLLLEELDNYNGEVIIKSFNPIIMKKIKNTTNKYKLGLLLTNSSNSRLLNKVYSTSIFLRYLKPDFIAINKRMLTKYYYKRIKDKYSIFVWTIKKKEELNKYQTKYPDISCLCNNLLY